ncbi:FecR family protein [Siphonobacter aquaeclarae]|uniref:FecR family protein n=1 Tax=Siphonobacter aquaeclarae TaxID=563176 RepID=A0A1G9XJ01_9BACT|nr:FecR family protein [Siphonobacter aquaeclarae]SDM96809.1 FecR family protein [Siphonobacter aquaeclarae]
MDKKDLYKKFGLEEPGHTPPDGVRREILGRIHDTLGFREKKVRRFRPALVAASLALVAGGVGATWLLSRRPATAETVAVPAGQVRHIILPDSSEVWLNAATRLTYGEDFRQNREVFLEDGEAFFKVRHDTTAPFVVHAGVIQTRVLGTTFRVKAYRELSNIRVSVVSGKVAVREGNKPLAILGKDQEITYSKTDRKTVETRVEAEETVQWQSGNVVLRSVSFEDIALAIGKAYDVTLVFDRETFSRCESSLVFNTHQSLTEVLDLLRDIQGINYHIQGKEVSISGTGCH